MRKLIVQSWISVDGYMTDQNDTVGFFADSVRETYRDPYQNEFLQNIDCILFGRKTYDEFVKVWPHRSTAGDLLAQKMNHEQKVVFSNSITRAPWGTFQKAQVETTDAITDVIRRLKSSNGENIVIWGSSSLVHHAMCDNLVDEFHLFIHPSITGGGKFFFQPRPMPYRSGWFIASNITAGWFSWPMRSYENKK